MKEIAVVGGGASGLMAAIAAAREGARVTLVEKNRQTGKKLLATGNGRCNFTNRNQDPSCYRSRNPELAAQILGAFPAQETVAFFEGLGILAKDRFGYLYPNSAQAASVAGALHLEAERLGVRMACNTEALAVEKAGGRFRIKARGWDCESDAAILACGSKAAPKTGSTGDGYRFAKRLGHSVILPLPALTGLCASEKDCAKLAGVRMDAEVALLVDGTVCIAEKGEVQFTAYGLSGIPVFQVSRYAALGLEAGSRCEIHLDVCPLHTKEQLVRFFREKNPYTEERRGADALLGMFPDKLSGALLERAGISLRKKRADWTAEDAKNLASQVKEMRFAIVRCRGYEQAQACMGGVPLTELRGVSMESSLVSGLYLAGELLDVDGACGGYNLQWAWSSGFLAGIHAAGTAVKL